MTLEILLLALGIFVGCRTIARSLDKVARELGNRNGLLGESIRQNANHLTALRGTPNRPK